MSRRRRQEATNESQEVPGDKNEPQERPKSVPRRPQKRPRSVLGAFREGSGGEPGSQRDPLWRAFWCQNRKNAFKKGLKNRCRKCMSKVSQDDAKIASKWHPKSMVLR